MKYGIGIILGGLVMTAGFASCQADVSRAGARSARVQDSKSTPPPSVVEDGSGGRWEYLLSSAGRSKSSGEWDGRLEGDVTNWYPNGVKKEEGSYLNREKHGPWTYWYESGQKRWEGTYKNGQTDGKELAWFENGMKRYEGTYREAKRHGKFTFWHENGNRWYEGEYKEGLKEGPFMYWTEDGVVDEARTGFYVRGKRVSD